MWGYLIVAQLKKVDEYGTIKLKLLLLIKYNYDIAYSAKWVEVTIYKSDSTQSYLTFMSIGLYYRHIGK